jgi:hypothetical protein
MVEDFAPKSGDDGTDAKVFVNGTRVPAGDVDVHLRREGAASVTSYAEAEIASPYNGVDYIDAFDGIDTDAQDTFDRLRIEVRDYETDGWHTQFHGMVTGVGNGDGGSSIFNCRAQGPGQFISNIPASQPFTAQNGLTTSVVLDYIARELSKATPDAFTIQRTTGDVDSLSSETGAIGDFFVEQARDLGVTVDENQNLWTSKTFTPNRHTLGDVVEWVENKTDSRVWVVPTEDGGNIVAFENPAQNVHEAHYLGGDIRVVENDAFAELRPINSLTLKGEAQRSLENTSDGFGGTSAVNKYVKTVARHKTLYERAGETALFAGKEVESDAENKFEANNEARRTLARAIEDTTGGDMVTLQRAPISPYDVVVAKPTCDQQTGTDTEPITYEVDRVHFKLRGGEHSTCTLNVGIRVDPTEDITILQSGWEDA